MKILIIVESPTKAKKLQAFLGDNYIVKSSFGHIRDLNKENMGIDISNNFKPNYVITNTKLVTELKNSQKYCSDVILASDLDREGEAIAWHLAEVLKLKDPKRIVFNNISKKAILDALKNPHKIDLNLVNAQQARRILDRLVGFELSPVTWKHVEKAKSAGRVQCVITRLVIDREKEIEKFESHSYYKTVGIFKNGLEGDLDKNFTNQDLNNNSVDNNNSIDNKEVIKFLDNCKIAEFTIGDIQKKKLKRYPSAPFRTSTLQQEAGRKLNMGAKIIMNHAQTLYENGYITYHRTDCVDISEEAMIEIKDYILDKFGEDYLNIRKYKTKAKDAQEAHECIRPTKIDLKNLDETNMNPLQKKLYEIIWKKTISSQMAPCEVEVYTVKIDINNRSEKFICKSEKIIFQGYKIIYDYKDIDEDEVEIDSQSKMERNLKIIESLQLNQKLNYKTITTTEKFTKATPHYSEATLTKKMEELGIGRPATTASIISTIQDRKYVIKETHKGKKVQYKIYTLMNNNITENFNETILEGEKNKLFPTDIGKDVTKFWMEYFSDIMNYQFTSKVESELDEIAKGNKIWSNVVQKFYENYHPNVVKLNSQQGKIDKKDINKRIVGKENNSDKNIYAYMGKYGPVLQIGDKKDEIRYVSIKEEYNIETITEEEANGLIKYPIILGKYNGKNIVLKDGKYGLYLQYDDKNYNMKDKENITLETAIDCIKGKDDKIIKVFNKSVKIMNGPYGPFILSGKKIVSVPKEIEDPSTITLDECKKIVDSYNLIVKNKTETKSKPSKYTHKNKDKYDPVLRKANKEAKKEIKAKKDKSKKDKSKKDKTENVTKKITIKKK